MQHYGIANVWEQGDFVTRGVLLALLVMSALSWAVIILKQANVARVRRMSRHAEQLFWHANSFEEALAKLGNQASPAIDNPFLALAVSAQEAAGHHQQTQPHLHDRMNISDWITRCLDDTLEAIVSNLQDRLVILASIGTTAPFVGLFGTVWGIYHALVAIGATGEASIDRVAGPVGESLIMTACGLFVAIPAVLGYNALTRANAATLTKLTRFANGLHAYFVTGSPLSSRSGKHMHAAPENAARAQADDGELNPQ